MISALLSRFRASSVPALVAASTEAAATVNAGHLVAAATADGAVLQRVQLLPVGTFRLRDGRGPFCVADRAAAEAIVAASLAYAGRRDIAIDYDHQMVNAIGPGKTGTAIASGWVKNLTADDAGVWADIEWTPAATDRLKAREYRYISPVFTAGKDGRVQAIRCAGLVNDNALDELPAVAAQTANQSRENDVNYAKIAAALGLPVAASEDDIVAAIAKMAMPVAASTQLQGLFGLAANATFEQLVAAATAGVPDPAKFVPAADMAAAAARLGVLEAERRERLITAATASGKLLPAQEGWAKSYIEKDEAGFNAWLAGAPVVVAAGSLLDGQVVAPGALSGDALTAAASEYIAAQAQKGITITADVAVRQVLKGK